MLRIINYFTAVIKVGRDKAVDYISYYTYYPQKEIDEQKCGSESDYDDEMDDYKNIITVDNFKDEKKNKRIFEGSGFIKEYKTFFDSPTHVVDNIYIGSAFNAASYYDLINQNIKVVINVTKEISEYYPDEFIYLNYDIYDNNDDSICKYLEKAYKDIKKHQKETKGNILIHCYMGSSRSASVVLYYLMREIKNDNGEYLTHNEALKFLKNKRPIVNPTFRFTKDLAKSVMEL